MTQMKRVTFRGYSDDIISWSVGDKHDEFSSYGNGKLVTSITIGGKIRVYAIYDGCWHFSIGQVDEEIPLPDCDVEIKQSDDCEYSTQISFLVPVGEHNVIFSKE